MWINGTGGGGGGYRALFPELHKRRSMNSGEQHIVRYRKQHTWEIGMLSVAGFGKLNRQETIASQGNRMQPLLSVG